MNTIRKIKKNAKALSPVVASIILIAVTVAVSIAVAVWMGTLVTNQMNTEQVNLGTPTFTATTVQLSVKNIGTSSVVIKEVYLNGGAILSSAIASPAGGIPFTIQANNQITLNFTTSITAGYNYQIKVVTSAGNPFLVTASSPV